MKVKLDRLNLYPENPRQGDIGLLTESLNQFGQYRPIVVNKPTMTILAGNHTYQAAAALGWSSIDVTYVDVDEETARRIMLVDNKTNDAASYDEELLADLLIELAQQSEAGLTGTGYDDDDLNVLLADLDRDVSWDDAMGNLGAPTGDLIQMTFTLHHTEKPLVEAALALAPDYHGPNSNTAGQQLVAILEDWANGS